MNILRLMSRWAQLSILAFVSAACLVIGLPLVLGDASHSSPSSNFHTAHQISYGLPARLKIPSINVDAMVETVGITSQGDLGTPNGPVNVGWYGHGPRPGEPGSSVIDGHFGWANGVPAVFDNLSKLQKGAKIYVQDAKGVTNIFVVRDVRNYNPNQEARSVFYSTDAKAHLNLITCEGIWDETSQSYSQRLVVFADKQTPS